MKTTRVLFLFAMAMCMAMGVMAQNLYDASGGRVIGKIYNNCIYDASGGRVIGRIDGERMMDGSGGRTLNYIQSDGRVMDGSGGYCVGHIESDGRVMDGSGGRTLGYVENGSVYDSSHGRKIGQYQGVEMKYVAYYYFFFPNKKAASTSTTTAPKKPGVTTATTPSGPQVKKTVIYDRDKKPLGTIYGTDYFISSSKNAIKFEFKKTNDGITILRQGQYYANIGKDNETIYAKQGTEIYARVDGKGNAFLKTGEQYGVIRDDGYVYATKSLDMPFGYVADKNFDRRMVGLMFFVCYYGVLHDYYKAVSNK